MHANKLSTSKRYSQLELVFLKTKRRMTQRKQNNPEKRAPGLSQEPANLFLTFRAILLISLYYNMSQFPSEKNGKATSKQSVMPVGTNKHKYLIRKHFIGQQNTNVKRLTKYCLSFTRCASLLPLYTLNYSVPMGMQMSNMPVSKPPMKHFQVLYF